MMGASVSVVARTGTPSGWLDAIAIGVFVLFTLASLHVLTAHQPHPVCHMQLHEALSFC